MALEEIRDERIKKLGKIRETGTDPYPASVKRSHLIGEALAKFSQFLRSKKKISLVGRLMAKREHGKSTFCDLKDGSGLIQIYFKEDVLGDNYRLFLDTGDIGDFISCEGKLFQTKKGEKTLEISAWSLISKSLLPLPEKWHGLLDVEERFRKRYLDLLINQEVRARFETRSEIIKAMRDFFEKNGFLEVETPMLHPLPGGALARPFKTHHNALNTDFYLRIAPELYLKRLLIGGFERVYEMGKSFRNEGIDVSHNPEFTEPECYAAYWDEDIMMKFVEEMFLHLTKTIFKKNSLEFSAQSGLARAGTADGSASKKENKKIIFKKPFARISFRDLLKRYALITDYDRETRDSLATRARQLGIDVEQHESKGKIADEIYKKICRPYLTQPTFLINHPIDISPLAKTYRDSIPVTGIESLLKSNETRRFQLVVAGMELTNGFAELNDPLEQRKRFEEQPPRSLSGRSSPTNVGGEGEEVHLMDEDYLEAMEYGMPPAAGLGIGLDRVVMLFTNTKNIREVVLFPTMKPR